MNGKVLASDRPEAHLLKCLARADMDPATASAIKRGVEAGLDWDYFLRMSRRHGLMLLAYRHLKDICPETAPAHVLWEFKSNYLANARRNLFLAEKLLEILDMLRVNGVEAVPLKGPALAQFAYGNISLRQFKDLDVIVRMRDLPKASEVLAQGGYKPLISSALQAEAARLGLLTELKFVSDDGFYLEVNGEFAPPYFPLTVKPEDLWGRLEPMRFLGSSVMTFPPGDMLLILCVHGAKHMWERAEWILSVAEIMRLNRDIDWESLLQRSRKAGCERLLLVGLLLADDLAPANCPDMVLQRMEHDAACRKLAVQAGQRHLKAGDATLRTRDLTLFYIKVTERLRDKVRFCLKRALAPNVRDVEFVSLPAAMLPLYYVLRPLRLVKVYSLAGLKRLRDAMKANVVKANNPG